MKLYGYILKLIISLHCIPCLNYNTDIFPAIFKKKLDIDEYETSGKNQTSVLTKYLECSILEMVMGNYNAAYSVWMGGLEVVD